MFAKLALKNLATQKARTILNILGIAIGVTALTALIGLSLGIQSSLFANLSNETSLTTLIVQPASATSGLFNLVSGGSTKKLTDENLNLIQKLSHVKSAYPEMNYANVSSIQVSLFGQTLQSDALIFGVPYEFIKTDLTDESGKLWQNPFDSAPSGPYPALISRKILDLYNYSVSGSTKLPPLNEKTVIGMDVTILPDHSSFFNSDETPTYSIKAKIVGFSDNVNIAGITLPLEAVRKLNQSFDPAYANKYLRFFITTDSPANTDAVKSEIEKLNLQVSSPVKEVQKLESDFRLITYALSAFSLVILLVAGLMIAITFLSSVGERKKEIGIFRALGATRLQIQKIFLSEAAILGFSGGLIGLILGFACGEFANYLLKQKLNFISIRNLNFFSLDFKTSILILLFSTFISLLFAFLPALKASTIKPLEALSK